MTNIQISHILSRIWIFG